MTVWAISDLHVGFDANRRAVEALPARPDDWLIVAGDTGDTLAQLELVLDVVTARFARVIWAPGNHDLWTPRQWPDARRGDGALPPAGRRVPGPRRGHARGSVRGLARARRRWPSRLLHALRLLVRARPDCRPTPPWPGPPTPACSAPTRCCCRRRRMPRRGDWCAARVAYTEARLAAMPAGTRIALVNHYPLRPDLAVLPRIPRFTIWCGTTKTADWHTRYPVDVVVSGHLHMRSTRWRDGVRFEEVSLGYPAQWQQDKGAGAYLRQILPPPPPAADGWGDDRTVIRHR